jgi:hypothetical protein
MVNLELVGAKLGGEVRYQLEAVCKLNLLAGEIPVHLAPVSCGGGFPAFS